jgi:hypothetical protein
MKKEILEWRKTLLKTTNYIFISISNQQATIHLGFDASNMTGKLRALISFNSVWPTYTALGVINLQKHRNREILEYKIFKEILWLQKKVLPETKLQKIVL